MTSPRDVRLDLPTMRIVPATARRAFVVALAVLVSACATTSGLERTMQGGSTIEGRMSVRYQDQSTGKQDASQGSFAWTSSGEELELSLLDPLGQTVALIRSDAKRSSIVFRGGRKVEGDSPEELTERTLGWTVPLHGLRYWLDGRTDPASAVTTLADGRVRQDGWTIRFVREDGAPADARPKRIDLAYPGPPAEIELRLVIDQRSAS